MTSMRKLAFDQVKIDTAFPRGIETIHFNRNGDVLRVTFSDGALTLDHPSFSFSEQSLHDVDLVAIYHLPAHYVRFRNRNNNRYIYGFHMPSCRNVGQETDEVDGEMTMRVGEEGAISVRYPDGQESDSRNNPFSDLKERPLEDVDMLALRTYALVEYRDRKTHETRFKVVQSGPPGLAYGAVPTGDTAGRRHSGVDDSTEAGVCSSSIATAQGLEMRYHGAAKIRGVDPPRSRYYNRGRFGRLFPTLPPLEAARNSLIELGAAGGIMDGYDQRPADGAVNPDSPVDLPAGFTFLGQFIDHDITFDPTSSLEREVDPEAVSNFRTPTLELDSVYGAGPGASPHLYQRADPDKLLIGQDTDGGANDLPRNPESVALIGDPRNDENLIISQLHLAFLKFHNAVVDRTRAAGVPAADVFREAQRQVRWHYQWMIVHEFLPDLIGKEMVEKLLAEGQEFYDWRNEPFIPVEFSVAAYRFGHSQVRPTYQINDQFARPIFAADAAVGADDLPNDLSGGRRIRPQQVIDWARFFRIDGSRPPQVSKAIDTKLTSPLLNLPFPSGAPSDPKSLAVRNLLRHLTFGLPSGQDVAWAMREDQLDPEDLHDLRGLGLDRYTPLWFYILREAERRAKRAHLGPVGGRIVGEVLIGLLEGDRLSYLRAGRNWTPHLGSGGDLKMADLLKVAGVA